MNKKALVVISFGSTFDETRKLDIGGIEAALATVRGGRGGKQRVASKTRAGAKAGVCAFGGCCVEEGFCQYLEL